jgi:Zn-dependent protease with chaperone function
VVLTQALTTLTVLWVLGGIYSQVLSGWFGVFAIAAVVASITLLRAGYRLVEGPPMLVVGEVLATGSDALIDRIHQIADKLGARRPDNVVLGMQSAFFVTADEVRLEGQRGVLKGETLCLSLPLLRLIEADELVAIVGHEVGHFRGADLAYTLRFAPAYHRLGAAFWALYGRDGRVLVPAIPALHMLAFLIDLFAEAEAAIGRDRELAADRASLEVASGEAYVRALLRSTIYGAIWDRTLDDGEFFRTAGDNLPLAFALALHAMGDEGFWAEQWAAAVQEPLPHPFDSHPPMGARFDALGVGTGDLVPESVRPSGVEGCTSLLTDVEGLERRLSELEVFSRQRLAPQAAGSVLARVTHGVAVQR